MVMKDGIANAHCTFPQYANVELQVVATKSSLAFFDKDKVEAAGEAVGKVLKVWRDEDEWSVSADFRLHESS
jgi:hypothetical protein